MFKKVFSLFTALVLVFLMAVSTLGTVATAAEYSTYSLTLVVDKTNNTATLTAVLPQGIQSGKIVFDTGDKLSLVPGSLSSEISKSIYESYDRDGVTGLAVTFAYTENFAPGTVVFTVDFTVNGDAGSITADDVEVKLWNLSNGNIRVASEENGDVNKNVVFIENYTVSFNVGNGGSIVGDTEITVPAGTAIADILPSYANGQIIFDAGYGFKSFSVTEGTVTSDITIDINFYRIGDVNFDGSTDNLDAAHILRFDAFLLEFDADQLVAADVNFDGQVNSLDAASVLKYDADLIEAFVYTAD